ncbi:DUF2938 domain-containing protein [Rhizobium sp. LC145]|uniref:DUF2938 domain-containing protein n=1 Tax=Rhizobium sp. LC145 TaxID=1120688 RepID=UPI00062A2140|nr:DUF2938 domain-containing protein [Rhizobium sp. LC145]KKX29484.1 membrane protein [Rhizobium sp. LC145]TKT66135.1 DUF2938 domain-containing protein [Rhizobiaceae bacterium LC148]
MFELFWRGAVIGIGATVLMDIWAIVLYRVFGQPKANWAPAGRWFWHLGRGKVFHENIADAEPYANELALGWIGHYAVGILYGLILAFIVGSAWFAAPTFLPAWILGIVTVGAGWFLMQPGLGLGWAASRTPNPTKVRALNLVAHTIFAAGLYGSALLIR